jgi:hypothetical protein
MVFITMGSKKNRLKNLFTASAMLVCLAGYAQSREPVTGVLLIKGPERAKDIPRKKQEIDLFNASFRNYPHRVVGSTGSDLDFKEVGQAVRELGGQCDNLLIFIDVHGGNRPKTFLIPGRKDSCVRIVNTLWSVADTTCRDTATSQDLFCVMGKNWRQGLNGVVLNASCRGSTDPYAFEQVPEATVITLSDPDKDAYSMQDYFYTACANQSAAIPHSWKKETIKTLIVTGMSQNYTGHEVHMRVFSTSPTEGNKFGGIVVSCDTRQLGNPEAWEKLHTIIRSSDHSLGDEEGKDLDILQKGFEDKKNRLEETTTSPSYRGLIYYLGYRLEDAAKRKKTIARFAEENRLIFPVYPPCSVIYKSDDFNEIGMEIAGAITVHSSKAQAREFQEP